MYSPVSRLLTVLDLLQARPSITAADLAERLEVNTRSVRRYIIMLQDLGIPVEAERGRYGGYRLRPGFKLPPLMWTEEEAVAVTLGLRAARQLGLSFPLSGVASALAKVERVLPLNLRERVQAVQDAVTLDLAAPPIRAISEQVMLLSTAAYRGQRVEIFYQAKDGGKTERALDCYGLLYHREQWYAIGYCHLRQSVRTFRLDRVLRVEPQTERFERPHDFDSLAYAVQAFAAIPSRWLAEVVLETTFEQIHRAVPPEYASLEEVPGGILLRAYEDDLKHLARFLLHLECSFSVVQPVELLEALQQAAEEIMVMVKQAKAKSLKQRQTPNKR